MAQSSTNLGLVLPEITDNLDPSVFFGNFQAIDTQIGLLKKDYVLSFSYQNGWFYRTWSSGIQEAWCISNKTTVIPLLDAIQTIQFPVAFSDTSYIALATLTSGDDGNMPVGQATCTVRVSSRTTSNLTLQYYNSDGSAPAGTYRSFIYILGRKGV